MERILLTGGAMILVGIVLAAFYFLIVSYGSTFEALEDSVVRWLDKM
ncbi:MAG: hypothetical protein ACT4O2_09525 [Beijerinckiaceae bacterium]